VKVLKFLIDLPFRFVFALIAFTFRGWIGWVGIVLIALKLFGVIGWPWWVAALPLEYGVLYCLYMTIDGALYRAGLKGVGGYAGFTTSDEQLARGELEQAALHSLKRLSREKKTPEEKERMMDSLKNCAL
jgi:hypothetical protein